MNIAPSTTSISTNQLAVVSAHSVAEVLPKTGEVPINALIAPVDRVQAVAAQPAYRKEPVVYAHPNQSAVKSSSKEKSAYSVGEDELHEQLVQELKARDQEVRAHELAHQTAGGAHAGAATYSYQIGPDGARYVVAGEVKVDLTEASDPQSTIEKMQKVQQAALAPSEPSVQDRMVAAQAGRKAAQAMSELTQQRQEHKQALMSARKLEKARIQEEQAEAQKAQDKAERKAAEDQQVSAAERNAQYNLKMKRINETLLMLSMPHQLETNQALKTNI